VPDIFVKIFPDFHKKNSVTNFTEIRPEGAASIHTEKRTHEGTDEANRRFSRLC